MLVKKMIFLLFVSCVPMASKAEISSSEIINSMKKGVLGVKKLLKKVSIYQLFSEDKTLLHYAVKDGDFETVQFLVNQNILLSQKGGQSDTTALHDAIYYGHLGMAQLLIEKGTPVNEQDIDGNTALHLAAEDGDLDLIEILLEYGASKDILNNSGDLPYDELPPLTWDDNKELQQLLSIRKSPKSNDSTESLLKNKIENSNSNNMVVHQITNSTMINNSHVGIQIQKDK